MLCRNQAYTMVQVDAIKNVMNTYASTRKADRAIYGAIH